jgi:hypothetical protein
MDAVRSLFAHESTKFKCCQDLLLIEVNYCVAKLRISMYHNIASCWFDCALCGLIFVPHSRDFDGRPCMLTVQVTESVDTLRATTLEYSLAFRLLPSSSWIRTDSVRNGVNDRQ